MKNNLNILLIILVVGVIGYVVYLSSKTVKIGYVRTGVVVEKYEGMADAKKVLEKKMSQWETNVDSLELNYQKSLDNYNRQLGGLKDKDKKEIKSRLDQQYDKIGDYVSVIEKKAIEENQKLTEGVINQINNYIKKYSEEEGYDLVLGVTAGGNILYGKDAIDVTDKILEGLNKEYKGQ